MEVIVPPNVLLSSKNKSESFSGEGSCHSFAGALLSNFQRESKQDMGPYVLLGWARQVHGPGLPEAGMGRQPLPPTVLVFPALTVQTERNGLFKKECQLCIQV